MTLTSQMADAKKDVRKRVEKAVDDILSAVWRFRSAGFRFEDYPELDVEVDQILQDLSDNNLEDAIKRSKDLLRTMELIDFYEESEEFAQQEVGGETPVYRFDMQSSHLKEIIEAWIVISFASNLTKTETRTNLFKYINNPSASTLWKEHYFGDFHWGKGYSRNPLEQMAVISQGIINTMFQYAKIQQFKEDGAIGYRTVRNSSFHCPYCDSMTERVWPLDEIVIPYHPRCVCLAVPVYPNG